MKNAKKVDQDGTLLLGGEKAEKIPPSNVIARI